MVKKAIVLCMSILLAITMVTTSVSANDIPEETDITNETIEGEIPSVDDNTSVESQDPVVSPLPTESTDPKQDQTITDPKDDTSDTTDTTIDETNDTETEVEPEPTPMPQAKIQGDEGIMLMSNEMSFDVGNSDGILGATRDLTLENNCSCSEENPHIIHGSGHGQIIAESGEHYVRLKNGTTITKNLGSQGAAVIIEGGAILHLSVSENGTATLDCKNSSGYPAIRTEDNSTLYIEGNGTLKAYGGDSAGISAAAIGTGYKAGGTHGNNVQIYITSGNVYAYGGGDASGIGGGENTSFGGAVTISGGLVYAEGEKSIGGGKAETWSTGNGSFTTGTDGNAILIVPDGIGDTSHFTDWSGIFMSRGASESSASCSNDTCTIDTSGLYYGAQVIGGVKPDYDLVINGSGHLGIENKITATNGVVYDNLDSKLIISKDRTLTNNSNINVQGTLVLENGVEKCQGSGSLTIDVDQGGKVQILLTEGLVSGIEDNAKKTFDGYPMSNDVVVALNLWGYSKTYVKDVDYILGQDFKANPIDVGNYTGSIEVKDTSEYLLYPNTSLEYSYEIEKAPFEVALPGNGQSFGLSEDADSVDDLPKVLDISVAEKIVESNYSLDKLKGLIGTALEWSYLDDVSGTYKEVDDEYVQNMEANMSYKLNWTCKNDRDTNFVESVSGELTINVTALTILDVKIYKDGEEVTDTLTFTYGDPEFDLEAKFFNHDTGEEVHNITHVWSSDNNNCVTVSQGEVTILKPTSDPVTIEVKVDQNGYYGSKDSVKITVAKKAIHIKNIKAVTRDYKYDNDQMEITFDYQDDVLEADKNDVIVEGKGIVASPNAGTNKEVKVTFALSGDNSDCYELKYYDTVYGTIEKADASSQTMEIEIYNRQNGTINKPIAFYAVNDGQDSGESIGRSITGTTFTINDQRYFTSDGTGVGLDNELENIVGKYDAVNGNNQAEVAAAKLTVSSTNYETYDIEVKVVAKKATENIWMITSEAGNGGTITPLGETFVKNGNTQKYTITPNAGYHIVNVYVGESKDTAQAKGALNEYTIDNISSDMYIRAEFAKDPTGGNNDPRPRPDHDSDKKYDRDDCASIGTGWVWSDDYDACIFSGWIIVDTSVK